MRARFFVVATLLLGCGVATPAGLDAGACRTAADCPPGEFECRDGRCQGGYVVKFCDAGRTSCDGDNVMTCAADEKSLEVTATCEGGCRVNPTTFEAACVPRICDPGATDGGEIRRCDGNEVQRCEARGRGWEPLETCALGCDATTVTCRGAPDGGP